jgi:hypothetical protein
VLSVISPSVITSSPRYTDESINFPPISLFSCHLRPFSVYFRSQEKGPEKRKKGGEREEKGRKREEIFMINIFGIEVSTQRVKVTKDQGKLIEPLVSL